MRGLKLRIWGVIFMGGQKPKKSKIKVKRMIAVF